MMKALLSVGLARRRNRGRRRGRRRLGRRGYFLIVLVIVVVLARPGAAKQPRATTRTTTIGETRLFLDRPRDRRRSRSSWRGEEIEGEDEHDDDC
jgi:hypothetical protein